MGLISGKLNSFDTDTLLFEDGDDVEYILYVKNGSVLFEGANEITYQAGDFIGMKDLYNGFYSGDYTVTAGSVVLPISASSAGDLYEFLNVNPQIHASISYELCIFITKLGEMYKRLYSDVEDFYSSILAMHKRYSECAGNAGIAEADFMLPHDVCNYRLDSLDCFKNYSIIKELSKSEPKAHTFIKANGLKFLKVQSELINDLYIAYDDMVYYLKTIISLFASKSQYCLFSLAASLADKAPGKYKSSILQLLTDMKTIIEHIDEDLRKNSGLIIDIDYNRVNFYFMMVHSMDENSEGSVDVLDDTLGFIDSDDADNGSTSDADNADNDGNDNNNSKKANDSSDENDDDISPIDINDILHRLCTFAGFDDNTYFTYNDLINKFLSLSDKESRDDNVRRFRKEMFEQFFKLYEEVFVKYAKSVDKSDLDYVEIFLDYGLIDERLLSDSQIEFLTTIPALTQHDRFKIYRMKDWLLSIYNKENVSSKNEFDMDYIDHVRERKKTEAITQAKERELLDNTELIVRYEIQNMLKYNLRLVNGNVLTCFPMLHMGSFERDIHNMLLTTEVISTAMDELLAIDYSIFYRELLISDPTNKIGKANVMREIFPNIILLPTSGFNGVMWQDTSGKRINSAGRFLLPVLYSGKLSDTLLTMFGRFRFELCKSAYGSAWNNIQVPSLTSEFCDYIQFYKKNKDLSPEKKESLKNQITRCRNNNREIFVYDYIIYMKFESAGAIRLNKVSRRILATYCPFKREIREKIGSQPIFDDAMQKYYRNKNKKIKETTNMIAALTRAGATITEEILNTKKFYEET